MTANNTLEQCETHKEATQSLQIFVMTVGTNISRLLCPRILVQSLHLPLFGAVDVAANSPVTAHSTTYCSYNILQHMSPQSSDHVPDALYSRMQQNTHWSVALNNCAALSSSKSFVVRGFRSTKCEKYLFVR